MTARGDFRRLSQLSASLKRASRTARKDVLKLFAVDLLTSTSECFDLSRSPYGEPWPKLRSPGPKRRDGKPLLDSGRLRNSLRSKPALSGVSISSNVSYAGIHNYGGTIQHKASTQPRNARGNRFISHQEAGKKQKASHRRLGVGTRVSFSPAHEGTIPRRQYLPDQQRGLPPSYAAKLIAAADAVQRQLGLDLGGA